jgi:putative beta barrel porin BBP7
MRKGFLGSVAVLAMGAGLTFGQYGPPPGPGGPPPYPMPGPGVVQGPPSMSGPSVTNGYSYSSPDGHPLIMPPGLDGMIPPGSMGAGAPGGAYPPDGHFGAAGNGVLQQMFGEGPRHVWAGVDWLWWTPKAQQVRDPLVTTSAAADFGILGRATTAALCGPNDNISFDQINGWRVWLGCALDERMAVEVGGFWLQTAKRLFSFQSNGGGLPLLAVPFFDADTGAATSLVVSFPGVAVGGINIAADTRVCSGEVNLILNAYRSDNCEPGGLEFFVGARYFQLEESFGIETHSTSLVAPLAVTTFDGIRTFNNFYGAQVGFRGEIGFGKWFAQLTGKFAAGYMRSWADLDGSTTFTEPGLVSTVPGGLFNAPQDICRHHADRFAILPEGGLNVGCQILPCLRVQAGYTFLWVNNVVRPTTSISPVLNTTMVPVSPNFTGSFPTNFVPRNVTRDDEFFLHGFNVGVQLSF